MSGEFYEMNEPVGSENFERPPTILCFEDEHLGHLWFFCCHRNEEGEMIGMRPGEMPGHWIRYRLGMQGLRACVHPSRHAELN